VADSVSAQPETTAFFTPSHQQVAVAVVPDGPVWHPRPEVRAVEEAATPQTCVTVPQEPPTRVTPEATTTQTPISAQAAAAEHQQSVKPGQPRNQVTVALA